MMEQPLVSVRRVERYEDGPMYEAVSAHLEALRAESLIPPDARVLLKPNLLAARDPALAATTHPAMLRAVARWLSEHRVRHVLLADSPGGIYTPAALRRVYAACGLNDLQSLLELNLDVSSGERGGFTLIRPVLDADIIINCPKLKTHGLTVQSAGVKNLFGCVPGLQKPEWHCKKTTIDSFSNLLIDLEQTVRPQLTLLDAVDCMEGNGPGGGTVRHAGVTLASRDVYALDEQAARLMGVKPSMAPVLRAARTRGLLGGETALVGDSLPVAEPPFLLPDAITKNERFFTPNGIFHHFCGRRTTRPWVDVEKCVGCGRCAESCPRQLIRVVERKAVFTRKGCIACFCCQEMCPAHAIEARGRR